MKGLLKAFPFLNDQPDKIIDFLSIEAKLLKYKLGQPLCRPAQPPGYVFFLLQGQCRSVVMSKRLVKGVATLQKFGPGSAIGWTPISCGGCKETLIASTNCVVAAISYAAMQKVMNANPPLNKRIINSVNPSELFDVLDKYLDQFPQQLGKEVIKAATQLSDNTAVVNISKQQWEILGLKGILEKLPQDRLWLVSSGIFNIGQRVAFDMQSLSSDQPITDQRYLGIPLNSLQSILKPPVNKSPLDQQPKSSEVSLEQQLFEKWQLHESQIRAERRKEEASNLDPWLETKSENDDVAEEAPQLPQPKRESVDDDSFDLDSYPYVKGVGPLESSIAVFKMLAELLGLPFRKELFRRVFSDQVQRHGEVSLALCGAVAESIGLHTQLLDVASQSVPRLEPPCLIKWGNGLAIIYASNTKEIILGIPASSNIKISWDEFALQWGESGEILTLKATDKTPKRKFGFSWFLPALQQHRSVLIEVLLASFFVQLFGLINPLLIQQVIDKAIINSSPDAMGVLGLLLVVFAIFEGLLLCLRTFLFVDTTNRIDLDLGTRIIDHLLRLPLSYFDRRPVGEVSSRVSEMEKIRGFLTGTALTTVLDAFFALLYIIVMLIYSIQLTFLALVSIPIMAFLTFLTAPIVRKQLQRRAIANARTQSHLVEVLSSMITVKAQNIELRSRWKWQDFYTDYVAEGFDNTLVSTVSSSLNGFLSKLSSLLVIWGGAYLVLDGSLTLGELIAFRIIAGYVTAPLLRMTSVWQSIQEVALSLERLSDVIDHPQEAPEDNSKRINMSTIQGKLDFRDIEFRYQQSSPLLLKGLNLEIPRGAFVAVVGLSGSGKSTLTKLLTRLYDAEKGTVLIDDIDISKVELYSLRRQIGVVPQETILFDGSVEDNISLTTPEASTEDVINAAKIACAHDFIMDLPAGYSNQVGERGSGLSGGQRQRVAIARTILQKPNLLIMDEATSALDYQTERVVCDNLMNALVDKTCLFITHRLSSITGADLIVVMGDGIVLEIGNHDQLISNRGPYYALFLQQGRSSDSSSPTESSGGGSLVPTNVSL